MPYFPNISKSSNKMSSNTSLDNTSDQDYSEFLNEYLLQTHSPNNEPEIQYEGKFRSTSVLYEFYISCNLDQFLFSSSLVLVQF